MILEDVKEVLNSPFEAVVSTPLSLKLLKCYSMLYLAGGQPRTCTNSQRNYYKQLSINGKEMATQLEKAQNRTCVPAWNGLKYVPKAARHFNSQFISDEEAIDLIKRGILKESDFTTLPEMPEEDPVFNEGEQNCIIEIAELLKEGATKKAIKDKYKDVKEIGGNPVTAKTWTNLIKAAEQLNG